MKQHRLIQWLLLVIIFISAGCNGQNRSDKPDKEGTRADHSKLVIPFLLDNDLSPVYNSPSSITRAIIEDRTGMIWFATFEGIIKYDGSSFTNVTKGISTSRFFSVIEDSKGELWFGSIGSGVFRYDGSAFQNFTTTDGLINDEIVCIYEDKIGNIWFGANGGVSMYDGKSFRNFIMDGDTIIEDRSGKTITAFQRPVNEVNSIVEDKAGKLWFGTRGNTFIYDGKTFNRVIQMGRPFINIRSIIQDKRGLIWLGGNDGLWRYDGITFNNITKNFVGYIYEGKNGNIWTSSESTNGWALSCYDFMSLDNEHRVTEIKTGEGMFFGISDDSDGNIWSGTLDGIYRYDGNTFDDFKR